MIGAKRHETVTQVTVGPPAKRVASVLPPNTSFDLYVSPNNITPVGTFLKVGSFTTDAAGAGVAGAGPFFYTRTAAPTTSIVVNIVPIEAPAQPTPFTATLPYM
jgi:hypothetical protein